jgi:hypothetical protein
VPTQSFRDYLFDRNDPRLAAIRGIGARDYLEVAKTDSFAGPMIEQWARLYPEPFTGITEAGVLREGLYELRPALPGEEAPIKDIVAAAENLLGLATPEDARKLRYPLEAHEWRSWANPEFMQHDTGLRLDELEPELREAALSLVEASLSEEGYRLVRNLMRINGFLGEIVDLPRLMNEHSYNIALFGEPSVDTPWGWHLFGHHVALNVLVAGTQMVISPVFLGAEPDVIDDGPHQGVRVFKERIELARTLMASLPEGLRREAQTFTSMIDPAMPADRIHPGDERHLGGCFQDNRTIPYEGIPVADMPIAQQDQVREILRDFILYLPEGPAAARMREIEAHFSETYFSWIGGWEPEDAFYFRLQSPVVIAELDHHTGVFLTNEEPAPFHMHTVLRTPHGNDYGRQLVKQYFAKNG